MSEALPARHGDEMSDLIPLYACGTLSPQEAQPVRRLLENHPELKYQVAEYLTLLTGFYACIEPVSPPPAVHQRLISSIRQTRAE